MSADFQQNRRQLLAAGEKCVVHLMQDCRSLLCVAPHHSKVALASQPPHASHAEFPSAQSKRPGHGQKSTEADKTRRSRLT